MCQISFCDSRSTFNQTLIKCLNSAERKTKGRPSNWQQVTCFWSPLLLSSPPLLSSSPLLPSPPLLSSSLLSSSLLSSPLLLQFSTSRVCMEATTTAALLSPVEETLPSCVSAVGRCVVGRWCASKTHTSMFTASPAKVTKNAATHLHTHTHIHSVHINTSSHTHTHTHTHTLPFSTSTLHIHLFLNLRLMLVFPCVVSTHVNLNN